jgi:RimJ/RimL family protein N-acetyltransferase
MGATLPRESVYFLRSARLGFRRWRDDDLELALGLWGDPAVTRLIDARGTLTREQVAERLARELTIDADHGVQYWPIFLLADDAHVGCCGLRPYEPAERVFELGFHIRSRHWRRGYALEAACAVMRYAFVELGVRGLFAGHNPKNDASRQLLARLGFKYVRDEYYPPTGLHHPSYLLGADDYLSQPPAAAE